MGHKCYISFKTEDDAYKIHIQENLSIDMIDKSGLYYYKWGNNSKVVRLREPYVCDQGDTWYKVDHYLGNDQWKRRSYVLTLDCDGSEHHLVPIEDSSYAELLFVYGDDDDTKR